MADALAALLPGSAAGFRTVYFGGGTPAICGLGPVLAALAPLVAPDAEVTVELHPLDVSDELLAMLTDHGVNRISMGVQSLDDATLVPDGLGGTAWRVAGPFLPLARAAEICRLAYS